MIVRELYNIASWTLLIMNINPNCGHVFVASDPICSCTSVIDGRHHFGQWLSASNLWPVFLVERRMWHEPISTLIMCGELSGGDTLERVNKT